MMLRGNSPRRWKWCTIVVLGMGLSLAVLPRSAVVRGQADDDRNFRKDFDIEGRESWYGGRNQYFILDVGYAMYFRGQEDGEKVELLLRVLDVVQSEAPGCRRWDFLIFVDSIKKQKCDEWDGADPKFMLE